MPKGQKASPHHRAAGKHTFGVRMSMTQRVFEKSSRETFCVVLWSLIYDPQLGVFLTCVAEKGCNCPPPPQCLPTKSMPTGRQSGGGGGYIILKETTTSQRKLKIMGLRNFPLLDCESERERKSLRFCIFSSVWPLVVACACKTSSFSIAKENLGECICLCLSLGKRTQEEIHRLSFVIVSLRMVL